MHVTYEPEAGAVAAIARGDHGDPFAILGMHASGEGIVVRTFQPDASAVDVLDAAGNAVATLERLHADGFFAGIVTGAKTPFAYRLRLTIGATTVDREDAYRFGEVLGDLDVYLMAEGRHHRLYERLGSHLATMDGVAGTTFAVWAPNARRVSVVGDFDAWDGRRYPMRRRGGGIWEIFIPGVGLGAVYKYEILGASGIQPLRADPLAFRAERAPGTASVVAEPGKLAWNDNGFIARRDASSGVQAPISIYEVHLGSWRRAEGNRYLTYGELAEQLVPYAASMGFTHLELMPVSEHPFDGSWGYQPVGLFAPTSRFGTPEEFAAFVETAHAAGLGVILDWVPGHFPTDAHGLGNFDGSHLYEHADPRQGFQPDWNTLIFNFGRAEVVNFLVASALFWIDRYHIDGLRVDAVASMLYLDYSRKAGEWIPNRFGGRENLEAVEMLRSVNASVAAEFPGAVTIAEESTAWPGVSRPVAEGGLGFAYKWNMGWMHDTLAFAHTDLLYRSFAQDQLTFSFVYAFSERFVLPFSHDEVVHGKGSLVDKMPGDRWQKFANLRALYGFMFAHPGKKLLFMGCEFAQDREWNHDRSLDWHLLDDASHAGVALLVRDLNAAYRETPALHRYDTEPRGLEVLLSDKAACVLAFARHGDRADETIVAVVNFTPLVREGYRVGVPHAGRYVEALNSDDVRYGGGGVANGPLDTQSAPWNDRPQSIVLTLPPLATVLLSLTT